MSDGTVKLAEVAEAIPIVLGWFPDAVDTLSIGTARAIGILAMFAMDRLIADMPLGPTRESMEESLAFVRIVYDDAFGVE